MQPHDRLDDRATSLHAEQARAHARVVPAAAAVASSLVVLLAFVMQGWVERMALLGWIASVAAATLLRVGLHVAHGRAPDAQARAGRWLARFRVALLLQGLAWAAGAALLGRIGDAWLVELLALALGGLIAGGMAALAFDAAAQVLLGLPALAGLGWMAVASPHIGLPHALAVSAALGLFTLVALRRTRVAQHLELARQAERAGRERALQQLADQRRAALAEKEHLVEQLLRTAHQGYWFVDLGLRTIEVNAAMSALLGRSRDSLVGQGAADALGAALRPTLAAEFQRCHAGADTRLELSFAHADGSRRHCLVNGSPLRDTTGAITGSVWVWTDITRRVEAEEALRVAQVVIDASADVVSVLDGQRRVRLVNDSWCRLVGLTRADAVGRVIGPAIEVVRSPARQAAWLECLTQRRRTSVRDEVLVAGSGARRLHTDYYPIDLDGVDNPLVAAVSRDVTHDELQRDALVAAAEHLRGTLDATGDAIFATDGDSADEPARFANDQLLQLWQLPSTLRSGLTPRHLQIRARELFIDPDAEEARIDAIVAAGVPCEDLIRFTDGRVIRRRFASVLLHGRRLRVWSMRDITVEHRAQASVQAAAAEQRALLDSFPGYIAVIDGDDRYQYVNEALARLFGRPAERIVGRALPDVMGELRWRRLRQQIALARQSGHSLSDTQYPSPCGPGTIDLEVTHVAGPPQADGSRPVYAFGIDVTERKRARLALVDALTEAERANAAKSQFLSHMSHELRTPLHAVLGFGQLLAEAPIGPEHRRHAGEVVRGARHLLELIGDLLDLGRIEVGRLEVSCGPVDAAFAVGQAIELMRPAADERDIGMHAAREIDAGLAVWADARRLQQVLLNLLSNAVKYNRKGGQVRVEVEATGEDVEFRVCDDGPGLEPHRQALLFRPFERAGAEHAGIDGTGIGLALSRQLLAAMGGSIGVRSRPGEGSVFWFRLGQAAPPRHACSAVPEQQAVQVRRARALCIDDNPVNLMLLQAMLSSRLDLVCASDPLQGLEIARAEPAPELVLLDIQLPGIDGFEVLERLRDDERTRALPVLAISARAMPGDVAAGRAAGFDAYLTKPVELRELLATVERLLEGRDGVPSPSCAAPAVSATGVPLQG